MRKIALISLLLVAGCATTTMADRRAGPFEISYRTAAPVDETIKCLTEALAATPARHTVSRYSDGWTIDWGVDGRWFLDVLPADGGGTQVNYVRRGIVDVTRPDVAAINSCR